MANFLDSFSSAVVLLDADAPDFAELALRVEAYFRERGIALQLRAVHKGSLFFAPLKSDLFFSLLPETSFALRLYARLSRARFKVGRFQLKRGKVFQLVVSDNTASLSSQTAVFQKITSILERIK